MRCEGSKTVINIILNGEARQVEAETLAALIETLELVPSKVAVERNLAIVPRSAYLNTELAEGDRIEIVQFVGGG